MGLGNLSEAYEIKLSEGAKTHAIFAPSNVQRVKVNVSCMERMDQLVSARKSNDQQHGARVAQTVRRHYDLCRPQAIQRECDA